MQVAAFRVNIYFLNGIFITTRRNQHGSVVERSSPDSKVVCSIPCQHVKLSLSKMLNAQLVNEVTMRRKSAPSKSPFKLPLTKPTSSTYFFFLFRPPAAPWKEAKLSGGAASSRAIFRGTVITFSPPVFSSHIISCECDNNKGCGGLRTSPRWVMRATVLAHSPTSRLQWLHVEVSAKQENMTYFVVVHFFF